MTSLLKKLSISIKIGAIKRCGMCLVSFQIVDRIRRQSSWASCELCSHRRRRRDKTVSSRRRRRCVFGIIVIQQIKVQWNLTSQLSGFIGALEFTVSFLSNQQHEIQPYVGLHGAQSAWAQDIFDRKYNACKISLTKCPNFTRFLPEKYFPEFLGQYIAFPCPTPSPSPVIMYFWRNTQQHGKLY